MLSKAKFVLCAASHWQVLVSLISVKLYRLLFEVSGSFCFYGLPSRAMIAGGLVPLPFSRRVPVRPGGRSCGRGGISSCSAARMRAGSRAIAGDDFRAQLGAACLDLGIEVG